MKTISDELKAHLASGTTTLAHLVKITRRDGAVLGVTLDHDREIVFENTVYQPAFSLIPSVVETSSALNVDNMDAKGALIALGVNEGDIAAGLWDAADVRVVRVNWADLTMGAEVIKRGWFGEISLGRGTFTSEVRGITQKLAQTLGDVVSPACKADLFDTRCGIEAIEGTWKFSGIAVTAFDSAREFTASGLEQAEGFFDGGKVLWTGGANAGLAMEIKQHASGGVIQLQQAMPYAIAEGDVGVFYAGCMKRAAEDCAAKFANIVRFRGFPTVPGADQMLKGP